MYETMLYWETAHTVPGQPSFVREFTGIWQAADKIVFSKTLASVPSARTRIERNFDPGMVRQLKSAAGHDMTVGGADLAGQAINAGLVDELQLFLVPVAWIGHPTVTRPDASQTQLMLLSGARADRPDPHRGLWWWMRRHRWGQVAPGGRVRRIAGWQEREFLQAAEGPETGKAPALAGCLARAAAAPACDPQAVHCPGDHPVTRREATGLTMWPSHCADPLAGSGATRPVLLPVRPAAGALAFFGPHPSVPPVDERTSISATAAPAGRAATLFRG